MNRLLLCLAMLLAGTVPAFAGPVAAVLPAIVTFLASPIGQIIIGVALQVGGSLLAKSRAKKNRQPVPGIRTQVAIGGDVPVSVALGRVATAGSRVYAGTWDAAGGSPNEYFVDVIALSDLPVAGLVSVFIDGEPVTLDSGSAHADYGIPVTEYRVGATDHLWVKFLDGSQSVADAYLRAKFGSDADMPFTADMVGRGVAYAIVTARLNRDLYRSVPQALFVLDGFKCYDPRKDTTAGGSGAHRRNDPATWEASRNVAVIAHQLLMGLYWDLTGTPQWVHGAQGLPAARLPFASWVAAMNECDVSIDLDAGGTEPQFTAGLEADGSTEVADLLDELMKSASGRIIETSAAYKCTIGIPASAVWAMTDEDVIISEGQSYEPFPGLEATNNTINATYPEPGEAWQVKAAPERSDAAMVTADGGRRLAAEIAYPAVSSGTQVQRLMETALRDARRFRTHALSLPPKAWLLEPGDVISWTSTRNGYTAKKFQITQMVGRRTFVQQVALKEVDPGDQDWTPADDEAAFDVTPVSPVRPAAQAMSGWAAAPATIGDAAGLGRRPAIEVSFTGELADIRAVAVQIRVAATAQMIFDGETPYDRAIASPSAVIGQNLLPATAYQARGRFLPFSGRETTWSDWLDVTTPDVGLSVSDFAAEMRASLARLRNDLRSLMRDVPTGIHEASLSSAQEALFRRSLKVAQDGLSASVVQESQARIDGDAALASAVTAVEAVAAAGTASGLVKLEAASAPAGVAARFGVYLRVDAVSGYDAEAAEFLEILDGGGTRKTIIADNTVLMGTDGEIFGLFGGENKAFFDNARIANLTADNIAAGTITTAQLDVENIQLGDTNITDGSVPYVTASNSGAINSSDYQLTLVSENTENHDVVEIVLRMELGAPGAVTNAYQVQFRNAAGSWIPFAYYTMPQAGTSFFYTQTFVASISDLYAYTSGTQFRVVRTGGTSTFAIRSVVAVVKAYFET